MAEQLGMPRERILAEPLRRNTAPCIAFGTFRIWNDNPKAVIAVTPADHLILKEEEFIKEMNESYKFALANDALLTLGIKPDRPETGYGYIQANNKIQVDGFQNLMKVKTFTEKPDHELASVFIESGDFYWNSGIFIWTAEAVLKAYEQHLPDLYHRFYAIRSDITGAAGDEKSISKAYSECTSISIDYGLMEKAENVFVKCIDIGWSDLGTWSSLWDHSNRDPEGNSSMSGRIYGYDLENNVINIAGNKVAVIQGLKDYIVVDTGDVLMIVNRKEEQNIKQYLDDVKRDTGKDFL